MKVNFLGGRFKSSVLFITVCSLFFLSLVLIGAEKAESQPYGAGDAAYLQQLTPAILELSEVGTQVSKSAIQWQNTPTVDCSNEVEFYRGVVGSLKEGVASSNPTPRLRGLHIIAVEGFTDYLTGLNLYAESCAEPDMGMKSKLTNKGTSYINEADKKIAEVNALIADPNLMPIQAAPADQISAWCGNKWPGNYRMQEYCIKTQTESQAKLNDLLKAYPRGSQENGIINKCSAMWKDGAGAHNYRMIVYCSQSEIAAFQRLSQ